MRKCLDAVVGQTFTDYECLLVDDGSKDSSGDICEEYARRDARFRALHKPNGGLSDARNYGLEQATGEYTIFFDPDDWVDSGCLEGLYATAKETGADMVICDYHNEDPYQKQYVRQRPTTLTREAVMEDLITGRLFGFTWNKLIRRTVYEQYGIRYPVGMYGCEDQYTMCEMLKNDIRVAYVPKAFYHYMHYGNDTLSRHYDEKTYEHDLKIREMFAALLADTPYGALAYERKTAAILSRAFYHGRKVFTSREFKRRFRPYREYVSGSWWMRALLRLSLSGLYQPARSVFELAYQAKQLLKKSRQKLA